MKRWAVALLAVLVLLSGSVVPSDAWSRGGGHFRGGGFHHGCCWGPGVFIGGLALGAAFAYPYYAYPYSYPVYAPPTVVEQPPVAYQQPPVQREVIYLNGKYVLYGDGVTQPWQWVWVPAAPAAPPPPPPPQ